ncbi:hypothetical protein [Sphingomonas sp.]|uniref:hypothetical protein n=1 Tax=Sphingomonas sp. TaxID=28214 RepID=UPI0025E2155F|nr:hypothetical protein [Sphingomonas sp.]
MLLLFGALIAIGAAPSSYAEGQVWQYKTRPQDVGSLLKIQKIEASRTGTIYHISLIGIHIRPGEVSVLQHAPVSQQTLDASVTQRVPDPGTFPDASGGIAEWRQAHGGVFTISISQIADVITQTVATQQPESPQHPT